MRHRRRQRHSTRSGARRRRLLLVFALIFGAASSRRAAQARQVPFARQTIAPASENHVSVASGDIDGDGDLDVISAVQESDKIVWFQNVGGAGGAWTTHTVSSTTTLVHAVALADVDGDGDLDVVAAAGYANVDWYENVGGGGTSWALHTITTSQQGAIAVAVADVDGDGDVDVLSASDDDGRIAWHENVGGGGTSWTLHTISTTAPRARGLTAADVDGDGDLDVLSASRPNDRIAWYENVGGGGTSWVLHTISATADGADGVAVGDLDGDGDLDVLSASGYDDKIAWYENVGGGGTEIAKSALVEMVPSTPRGRRRARSPTASRWTSSRSP